MRLGDEQVKLVADRLLDVLFKLLGAVKPGEAEAAGLYASGVLAIFETLAAHQLLGSGDEDNLGRFSNLLRRLCDEGVLSSASRTLQALSEVISDALGSDHPYALVLRIKLVCASRSAGDMADAIAMDVQTLQNRLRVLGPIHPDTLMSRDILAADYESASDLSRAIFMCEQTLQNRRLVLGPDHPDTVSIRRVLSTLRASAGDVTVAITPYQQAFEDCRRMNGVDHPDTLMAMNNLAWVCLWSIGDLVSAISIFEATLQIGPRRLDLNHPNMLVFRNSLASAYLMDGRYAAALPLLRTQLAWYQEHQPEHEDIPVLQQWIAQISDQ